MPFLLLRLVFTVSFTVGVVTRDKVKRLGAEFTAFTVSQKILILSATMKCTLTNTVILLTWIGARPVEDTYILTGQILTTLHFYTTW